MDGRKQHTQTCSQRRDRKRKNPTPEKIEAMSEKVLTFVTEEPPEDIIMTYPVVSSQMVDNNGKQDDRLMDGHGKMLITTHCTKTSMDSIGGGLPTSLANNYVPTGRPRGRPRLNKSEVPKTKKPLGRPRIHPAVTQEQKRPPGRPRIHPVKDPSLKKPRGRPRKNPIVFNIRQSHEEEIKHLMALLAEKDAEICLLRRRLHELYVWDAEICLLRRRLHELGEVIPTADAQKLDNNDMTTSKRRFVYVNPDGSIQDINPPAAPCNGRIVESAKYITMHESLSASATEHISLGNGISVWQNH
ncbi:hypothetical protein LSAT2_024918 [Lamellibrachia satsuma]|nr:hypothetical protein LSAT2_024918 [Lamellibrachia satsuma]